MQVQPDRVPPQRKSPLLRIWKRQRRRNPNSVNDLHEEDDGRENRKVDGLTTVGLSDLGAPLPLRERPVMRDHSSESSSQNDTYSRYNDDKPVTTLQ